MSNMPGRRLPSLSRHDKYIVTLIRVQVSRNL